MRPTKLFTEFFESEKAGGISLIICTLVSLTLANSSFQQSYLQLWHLQIGGLSIEGWINEGLMAIFFLLIGLELERAIFLVFNYGKPTQPGAGISMATDISFAIGILSLLGKRVRASLKVLLTAIAVIADLGAIIVIALFYAGSFDFLNLLISLGVFGLLLILIRLKLNKLWPYITGGIIWYFMLRSGVHATITAVFLAFAIPFSNLNIQRNGIERNIAGMTPQFHSKSFIVGRLSLRLIILNETG